MAEKENIKSELKKFKKRLSKVMPIEKMIFFGSGTRGMAKRDSDIDIIIVSPKFSGMKFRQRPVSFYDYWFLNYPVDFLCYTPEEFSKMSRGITIVREAVRTGKEIK